VQQDHLATGVFASLGPGDRYPQLFQLDASPQAPHSTAEVEEAIYEEISRLAEEGPSETELIRVRNQIEAGRVRRLQSNLGLAFQLAESTRLFGDWHATFQLPERLASVTPDEVRRVAATYLTRANRTVATLRREEGS
jgi:predicted Zn-dependent peptidase